MADREKGPLERETFAAFQKATLSSPTIHGLAQERLSPKDVKDLRISERAAIDAFNARSLGVIRQVIERLAREIDALHAASHGGDNPPDSD